MPTNELLVKRIQVSGVLGQYTHRVQFQVDNPFVLIYGPNGVGKTKFLEVIDGLFELNWRQLFELPFDEATVTFQDGRTFRVARSREGQTEDDQQRLVLEFQLWTPGVESTAWRIGSDESLYFENWLRKDTSWVPFRGQTWRDQTDGELAEIGELETRYGRNLKSGSARSPKPPEKIRDFAAGLHSQLIETQRLKIEAEPDSGWLQANRRRKTTSTIVEYANEMKRLLSSALAENSRNTQQLDRTFPSRMLTQAPVVASSEDDIRKKYDLQNSFRSRLAQIALIDLEAELSLPERPLSPFEVSMLDLYLKDADSKLESFESLLDKISLLERIINSRLLGKALHIDAQEGIAVRRETDSSLIALDSLSSGEQHEIILMYNLLFNVDPGSLVLIDEPEISLHISWQINFIADVRQIAELSGFQFLVATHSPQIINNWWSYATKLGPADAEF